MALDNIGGVGGLVSIIFVVLLVPAGFFGIYYSTLLPSEQEALIDWLGKLVGWQSPLATLSSLLTYFIFLAGPITDVISQQYRYSIASIVSLFGVIITKIFNSSQFHDFSEYFISPVAPAYWGLTADSSAIWMVVFRFLTIPMALLIVVLISTPTALAATGYSKYASITGSVLSALTGLITLSGLELIGRPLTTEQKAAIEQGKKARAIQRASEKSLFNETRERIKAERRGPFNDAPKGSLADLTRDIQLGGSSYVKIDPDSPDGLCDIPGTGNFFSNTLAPPSIIMTQTIIWCHLIEQWDTKSTSEGSAGLIVTSLLTFALQWLTLNGAGCLENGKYIYGTYSPLISLLLSIVFAGSAYGTLKVTKEGFTPETKLREHMGVFSNIQDPSTTSSTDKSKIKVGEPADKNLAVNDEDQFVCEAYKDGELVTSTLVG
jgi:hypothetical protein